MDVLIRRAAEDEIDALIRLLDLLVAQEDDFSLDAEKADRGLRFMLAAPDSRTVMVAVTDTDTVIGMVGGQLLPSSVEGAPVLLVEDFVVDPDWRGRGIGKRLLEAILAWGRERGAVRSQLLADRNNDVAIGFYERQNWKQSNLTYFFKRI